MLPYRVVRTFTTPASDAERCLTRLLELPLPPQRGQDVCLLGVAEPLRIARVTMTAREAAGTWQPGFVAVELVRVELEPEDATGYDTATTAGWAPLKG